MAKEEDLNSEDSFSLASSWFNFASFKLKFQ